MQEKKKYYQTKYVITDNCINASKNRKYLADASYLNAQLIGKLYEEGLPKYCKGKLLDLGCGNVPFYEAYKKYITDNICVDWDNSKHKNPYLDLHCDLIEDLPFEDEMFDTIILSDVLEHIPNSSHLIMEMARILKPRGNIILNSPFMYPIHEKPYDYARYTEFWYKQEAKEAGLKVMELKPIGDMLDVLIDMTGKMIARKIQFLPIARWYQQLYYLLCSRKKQKKQFFEVTLGYYIVLHKK